MCHWLAEATFPQPFECARMTSSISSVSSRQDLSATIETGRKVACFATFVSGGGGSGGSDGGHVGVQPSTCSMGWTEVHTYLTSVCVAGGLWSSAAINAAVSNVRPRSDEKMTSTPPSARSRLPNAVAPYHQPDMIRAEELSARPAEYTVRSFH